MAKKGSKDQKMIGGKGIPKAGREGRELEFDNPISETEDSDIVADVVADADVDPFRKMRENKSAEVVVDT